MSATFELELGKEFKIHLFNVNKFLAHSTICKDKLTFDLLSQYHLQITFLRSTIPNFDSIQLDQYPNVKSALKVLNQH